VDARDRLGLPLGEGKPMTGAATSLEDGARPRVAEKPQQRLSDARVVVRAIPAIEAVGDAVVVELGAHTLITSTKSLTAAADFLNAASSSGVSLISMIFSRPRAPIFTGTPTKRSRTP